MWIQNLQTEQNEHKVLGFIFSLPPCSSYEFKNQPGSIKAGEETKLKVCQLSVMADDILYLFCNILKINF